jgi:hypothetical protein
LKLVILDTNAYLRLAKRIRPILGFEIGQKQYVLKVLPSVEKEVIRNLVLAEKFPWFDGTAYAVERAAHKVRFTKEQRASWESTSSVLRAYVARNSANFKNPPSNVDCDVLACGLDEVLDALVVTDDESMLALSSQFGIKCISSNQLLKILLSAKVIDKEKVREIFDAMAINGDMPQRWLNEAGTLFKTVFSKAQLDAIKQRRA